MEREAYVVEIAHDDNEALVLLAKQPVLGRFGIVELDVSSRCSGGVRGFDRLDFDLFRLWHKNDRESFLGLATDNEVVGEHAVRYPFLRSVDDPVLSIVT